MPRTHTRRSRAQAELARLAGDPASVTQPRLARDLRDRPPPPPPSGVAGAGGEPLAAWESAANGARAALEAQALRGLNVELAARFGVEAWKGHVGELDALAAGVRARAGRGAAAVDALNAARQEAQASVGPRLKTLARRWEEASRGNASAELALLDASREAKRLRGFAREAGLLGDDDEGEREPGAAGGGHGGKGGNGGAAAR